jgi:hypothetical protein
LHTSSRRIRAASWRCLAAAIVARSTRGTGRQPHPRCLAGDSSDRTVQLWNWPQPVQSAPRRLVTRHRRLGGVQPQQNPRRRRQGQVRAAVARGHSLSSCCPGSAHPRAGPAGSSHLTQTTQICFQAPPPLLPVRLPVNRCGSAISGDTHGPCSRLPLHCQPCQRSLTRKRSLFKSRIAHQHHPWSDGLCDSLDARAISMW